jgi:AcrR family transcriptional regulator
MGVEVTGRRYGGRSGEERSAERRAALLDAAFRLVAADDWHALRIEAICREAGLSKRYFYESFGGLEELSAALIGRLADELVAVTLAGAREARTPDRFVRAALEPFVAHLAEDPRRARVLFGAVPGDGAAARHRDEVLHRLIRTAVGLGLEVHGVPGGPAIDRGASFLVGGTSQLVLDWLGVEDPSPREDVVEQLAGLWQAVVDATFGPRGG